ncbi:hypothetical protein, partial [Frankia sp. AvcI1]
DPSRAVALAAVGRR